MTTIKPCPFCGNDGELIDISDPYVECQTCGATGPFNMDGTEAIEAWNRADMSGLVSNECVSCGGHIAPPLTCGVCIKFSKAKP